MAKKSDIQSQIDALQAELADADTDDEVWVKEGGREIKISGKRATGILSKFADLWKDDTEDGDGDGDEDEDVKDDKKPGGQGYFGKRAK